jgi:hypothetical protein
MVHIKQSLLNFVHAIATTTEPDLEIVKSISIGFNITYQDLEVEMITITEQAYNGLNKEAGDWCKEIMKVLLDIRFS